jgi:hypothetical protein
MISLLEERYRRALRMLPASYRAAWEDDMVATFLERAYAAAPDDPEGVEISSPSASELASIAALAFRLRLGGRDAPPRYLAWGDAIRLVALVGLLANTMMALVGIVLAVWMVQRMPGLNIPVDASAVDRLSRWQVLWSFNGLLWPLALLSIVYGYRRAAIGFGVAAFLPVVWANAEDLVIRQGIHLTSRLYDLLFIGLPLLALAAFRRDSPPVRARAWLVAVPVGVVATFAPLLANQAVAWDTPLVDWPGLWCAGLAIASGILLADSRRRGATPSWSLALALLSLAAFGLRVLTLLDYRPYLATIPGGTAVTIIDTAEAVIVLVTAGALTVSASRALRRLSPSPP